MREIGIDISQQQSKSIDEFLNQQFDYVITVCESANAQCPEFLVKTQRLHWSIEDPAAVQGDSSRLAAFRRARNEIGERLKEFVMTDRREKTLPRQRAAKQE
jgi:arsenate reductase (thioredoxin)